jgi:hypothetical protein
MNRRSLPMAPTKASDSFVVYRGPSAIDPNVEIVAIVTGIVRPSANTKTGPMAQLWIMVASEAPHLAQKSGLDAAVCGNCPMRPLLAMLARASGNPDAPICYVKTFQGPRATWEANHARPVDLDGALRALRAMGRALRLGAYGDPAAVPESVVRALAEASDGVTGYTHQWRDERFSWLKSYALASADNYHDRDSAHAMGWRSYRVIDTGAIFHDLQDEVYCPHVTHGAQCYRCGLCDGATTNDNRRSVAILAH